MRTHWIFLAVLSFLSSFGQVQNSSPNAQDVAPITGTVELSNSLGANFTYYFDHNALKDGVQVADSLIVLTESGNLLRFDIPTLNMNGQAVVPGRGTVISSEGSNKVLIGTETGQILEVDPVNLDLRSVASVEGKIIWLAGDPPTESGDGRIVVVVDNYPDVWPWPGENFKDYDTRSAAAGRKKVNPHFVEVIANGKTRSFPLTLGKNLSLPNTYVVDRSGRLWMGSDNGEWGGECSYMDLRTGKTHGISMSIGGVLGFLESADGRLFVYGGTSHMGMNDGYISQVKDEALETLAEFESNDWSRQKPVPENVQQIINQSKVALDRQKAQVALSNNTPRGPIELIIDDVVTSGYWIVSAHSLYHADSEFSQWRKVVSLGGRWNGGRRFSVGNTPTVNRVIVDKTGPGQLLAVMGRDGLDRIAGDKVEHRLLEGQLESPILDIWKTSSGAVFLGDDDLHTGWKLSTTQWQAIALYPDRLPSGSGGGWYFAEPVGNDGSSMLAFVGANISPGERDLVRLGPEKSAQIVENWNGSESRWDTSFLVTSKGKLLKIAGNQLLIRGDHDWSPAGQSKLPDSSERKQVLEGRRYILLAETDRGDLFLDASLGDLVKLSRIRENSYLLEPLKFATKQAPSGIFDGIPDSEGWVLLATAHGLLKLHTLDGRTERVTSPNASEEIKSVCRDGQGRLWAAGDRVYISSDDGKRWTPVLLPMLDKSYATRVRVNPSNPRQLFLSLYDRGIVTIEW